MSGADARQQGIYLAKREWAVHADADHIGVQAGVRAEPAVWSHIRLDTDRLKINRTASYCATINSRRAKQVVPGNRQIACHSSGHMKF